VVIIVEWNIVIFLAVPPVVRHFEFALGIKGQVAKAHDRYIIIERQLQHILQVINRADSFSIDFHRLRRFTQVFVQNLLDVGQNFFLVPEVIGFTGLEVVIHLLKKCRMIMFGLAWQKPGISSLRNCSIDLHPLYHSIRLGTTRED